MTTKESMNTYRTTSRVVGTLFLAGMVIGVVGHLLIQSLLGASDYLSTVSTNSRMVAIGAMLMLMTAVWDAAHGVLMFPVLKQHNERIALGYFGARLLDAAFLAFQVLFVLLQIPLGSEYLKAGVSDASYLQALGTLLIQVNLYAYQIGMIAVGLAGLMLCYTFYRAKLVLRFVAVWGLIGYATLLGGSMLEVLGFDLHSIHTIPGGLWELFIGVWLIAKGFNASTIAFESVKTEINQRDKMSLSEA
jgi:hypothetical protein